MNQQLAARNTVLEVVQKGKQGFIDRLPKDIDADRMFLGLVTLVQKRPDIAECDPGSIIIAGYEAAEIGINLNPALGLGYVVPYKGIAQFQLGYRGMIQKAYEMGVAKEIFAEVVYENDSFRRVLAPARTVEHVPANGDRGEPVGAYAFMRFRDGGVDFEYLTKEQIMRHKAHSKAPNSLMWSTFWEEAWRKTPIRVLFKRMPLTSAGIERFAELIFKDSENDFDMLPLPPEKPEIRRAAPKLMESAEMAPDKPAEAAAVAQPPAETNAKGRGSGKGATAPAETVAESPAFADKDDIARFWKRAYDVGWSAAEVKNWLAPKGYAGVKDIPKNKVEEIIRELEAGGPPPPPA